ncbi:MAG TPA: peptidoglycan-binding protein [Bauldia sp.]|nr:peptidoglycan-binding protein [Bauldia sp.]
MKAGRPWNLSGVDKDTREAVIEAARLSGLSVGQWLNQVLGENFAEPDLGEGNPPPPAADDETTALAKAIDRLTRRLGSMDEASRASIAALPDRLDEIEHNISRLSSDRQTGAERARSLKGVAELVSALARDVDNADERARSMVEGLKARAAGAAPRANVQRVSQAISELEGRIVEMRNRTAPPVPDAQRPQKLDEIRGRLDALLARSEENAKAAAAPASDIDDALKALESRIDDAKADITARLTAQAEMEPPPAAVSADDINRIEDRLADIAARLADSEGAQVERLEAIAARFDAAEAERKKPRKEVELASAIREISAHQKQIDDRAETLAMRRDQKALAAAIGALQVDLTTLTDQVSAISRVGNEQHGAFFEVAKHVESLATEKPMDRSLLNAIRGDLETMRGMIEGGARETTLGNAQAKADGIAAQLSDLIRITPDRGKLDALSGEVAALRASLEADDSPRAIQRLEMRVSELGRSLELALASRQTPDPAVERLENQMQDIAARLEGLRDTGAHTAAIHTVEQRLDGRLNEIADRLGGLMNATPRTIETAEQRLAGRFDDLAGRLSGMFDEAARPQAEAIETAEQRITGRIDAFAGRLGGMLDDAARPQAEALERTQRQLENRLEDIVNRLGGMFDTAPQKAAIEHVHERLSAITDRIDRLNASQKEPSAALDAIKSEIGTLRKEMSEKETPATPVISTDNLEKQIRDLARQLDTVTQNRGENEGLADLEAQVARLAGDLEVTKPRVAELTSIESRLDKLQALLDDTAQESIASARSEAKKAVAELSGIARDNEIDAQLVKGLMRDLDSLRNSSGDSDKETRSKLEQVSHTVAQVVDRLSVLETETVAAAARAAKAGKPARSEFRPAPKPEMTKTESPLPSPTGGLLDTPSLAWTAAFRGLADADRAKPEAADAGGEGKRPALIATRGDGIGPLPSTPSPEKRAAERRADFIAAARRAAQAVAKEAAAMDAPGAATPDAPAQMAESAERRPGAFARLSQAIRSRKRPLLLAAAAIVLAIGAMQAYGKFTLPSMSTALADISVPSAEAPVSQKAEGRVRNIIAEADAAVTPGAPVSEAALVPPPATPSAAVAFAPPETADHFSSEPTQPPTGGFAAPVETAAAATSDTPPLPAAASDSVGTADATAKPVVLASADTSSTAQPATIAGLDARLGSPKLLNAAASGDGAAEFEIATRYAEGSVVGKDLGEAARWYQKAAEAGVAVAQYRLGSLYERGQGVSKDLTQAVNWYQRAADQGNVNAMHNLAVLMSEGADGPPDHDKALQWFLAAANYGVRDSQYNLGVIYARAIGVQQDLVESYKWFAVAAAQGDTDAAARRDEVAKVLSADDLTKARATVTAWHVKPPIAEANGVASPAGGWDGPGEMLSDADRQALVAKIQTLLADAGYDVGPADGVAGPKTADAVKAYQQKQGIEPTGAIDNSLLAMLTDGK